MAFAAGVFSLIAGNPVVTGTTISSTWANNTLSDIATGLSTAVLKDGTQTTTAVVPFVQGVSIGSGANILALTQKRMTADVTVIASAFATVTAFSFSIAANREWQADYFLSPNIATSLPGMRFSIVTPAGATQNIVGSAVFNGANPGSAQTTTSGAAIQVVNANISPGGDVYSNISLWVLNGATPGNVDMQISTVTATTTGITLRKGSHMYAIQLA